MVISNSYILHTRLFRDTSAILECFTSDHGLVSMVARGARKPRSRLYGLIQPFIALQLSWIGRGELKTLTQIEAQNYSPRLAGEKIALGFYLNELLIRLLNHFDPHPVLFSDYNDAISALSLAQSSNKQQRILRHFEKKLLAELGYGLDLTMEGRTGEKISPELLYCYEPSIGMIEVSADPSAKVAISGASVMALHQEEYENETQLREAKNLMRFVLAHYLGNKPLHSRKLFSARTLHDSST